MAENEFELVIPKSEDSLEELKERISNVKEMPILEKNAVDFASKISGIDANNQSQKNKALEALEKIGEDLYQQSSQKSKMLDISLKQLSGKGKEGTEVTNNFLLLKDKMMELNPDNYNLNKKKSFFGKAIDPVKNYFEKFTKVDAIIQDISLRLDDAMLTLQRDNVTLQNEGEKLILISKELKKTIEMLIISKRETMEKLKIETDPVQKQYLEGDIVFTINQKILDFQTRLGANFLIVATSDSLIKTNKELIRGISRTKSTSLEVLKASVITIKALSDQKNYIDMKTEVDNMTSKLLVSTSEQLRNQGVEIQKQAATSTLNMEDLKTAINTVIGSIEDYSKFRIDALTEMDKQISELDSVLDRGKEMISKLGFQEQQKLM